MILVVDTGALQKEFWVNLQTLYEGPFHVAHFGEWKDWEDLMVDLGLFLPGGRPAKMVDSGNCRISLDDTR